MKVGTFMYKSSENCLRLNILNVRLYSNQTNAYLPKCVFYFLNYNNNKYNDTLKNSYNYIEFL